MNILTDHALESLLVVTLTVALLSLCAWLIARLFANTAALRHLILSCALFACLASPFITWFCHARRISVVAVPILRHERIIIRPQAPRTEVQQVFGCPTAAASPSGATIPDCCDPVARTSATTQPIVSQITPAPPAAPPTTRFTYRDFASAAIVLWATGTLLLFARLGLHLTRIVRLRRSSQPLDDPRLAEICASLGLRRSPLLLVCDRTIIPIAFGLGKPAILLPESLVRSMSTQELRDILVHELAHLQRRDQWIALLQAIAAALYWPILPLHALNRELRRAREEICDNVVLRDRSPIHYGHTLLHVAETLLGVRPMPLALGVIAQRGELERRVASLLRPDRSTSTQLPRIARFVVPVIFIAAVALLAATRFGFAANPTTNPDDPKLAGHFSGRVTNAYGQPLRGARIYVARLRNYYTDELPDTSAGVVRATSDNNGDFAFDAPDMTVTDLDGLPTPRYCVIVAAAAGYAPDWFERRGRSRSTTIQDATTGDDLLLQLAPDDVPINGRLLDPDGRPLAGARVRVTGVFIPPKRDLNGYLEEERKRSRLSCSTAYDRDLYQPELLPNVKIETQTDGNGQFTFSGLGRDRVVTLSVHAPSVIDTTLQVMTRNSADVPVHLGDEAMGLHLNSLEREIIHGSNFSKQLKRGLTIHGVVRDRDTHAAVPNMWVTYRRNPLLDPAHAADAVVSDANGRFTISGLYLEMLTWGKEHRDIAAIPQPGMQYVMSQGIVDDTGQVVIDCVRGIPFRLNVLDEHGQSVEARVEYHPLMPNPQIEDVLKPFAGSNWGVFSRAARRADGSYEGFVLPGPGAIVVKTQSGSFRPAHVDTKTFAGPNGINWQLQGWQEQNLYSAILPIEPARGAAPLQMTTTLQKAIHRRVTLLDPDGKPVEGAQTSGMTPFPYDYEPPLRPSTFVLHNLHPDRAQRIVFTDNKRKLVGFLLARGDGESDYVVHMQPWATIKGRLLDRNGKPHGTTLTFPDFTDPRNFDPQLGARGAVTTEFDGQFTIEQLVPGQRYTAQIWENNKLVGNAFQNLTLQPGELRPLGDVQIK